MFKVVWLALCFSLAAQARPTEWVFLYEKAGFRAYEHKGPPLAYKAEGILDLPLPEVAAVLVDIPRQKEWVHRLAESRVLEGNPLSRSVIYSRYTLPWPATDRDAVIESTVAENIKRAEVHVRFQNSTSPSAPVRRNCIRVPLSEGAFSIRDTGQGTVFVSYSISLDPGGWLPDWIVSVFVQDAPLSTLQAFRAQVIKTRGQYSDFIAAQKARWSSDQR